MNNASFFENLVEVLKLKSMTEIRKKSTIKEIPQKIKSIYFGGKSNFKVLLRLKVTIFKNGKCQIYSWFSQICAY